MPVDCWMEEWGQMVTDKVGAVEEGWGHEDSTGDKGTHW